MIDTLTMPRDLVAGKVHYPLLPAPVDPGVFFRPIAELPGRPSYPRSNITAGTVFRRPAGAGLFRVVELFDDGMIGGDLIELDNPCPSAWLELSPPDLADFERIGG